MENKNTVYAICHFEWKGKDSRSKLTLHEKTREQAIKEAALFGYCEPRWYRPSSWNNHSYFIP